MADFIGKGSGTFQSGSIKKGNILFGVDESNFGPSSETGYYNYYRGGSSGSFTIVEAQSDLQSHLKTRKFDNSSDLINYYNEHYNSTPSTLQEVVDDVSSNDNLAIIAVTDYEDTNLEVAHGYEAYNRSHTGTALNKFVRMNGHFSSHENSEGCNWVVMVNANANVGMPYEGTILKQIDPSTGTINSVVTSSNPPTSVGTGVLNAGYIVQSNKPIYLCDQGNQHKIACLSYSGKILASYSNRYYNQTVRIFCKHDGTTITRTLDSVDGEVLSTHTGNYGDIITIVITSTYTNKWIFYKANKPIVGTSAGVSGDFYQLPVVSKEKIYRRRNGYEVATDGSSPDTNNTYIIEDAKGAVAVAIADGAGGDAEAGISARFLSNTYAYGQGALKSYFITSPSNQTITAKYWNGSSWTTYATHTITGASATSPSVVSEGDQDGSTVLVDTTDRVWLFEGTNNFYMVVNDASGDEEALLGWDKDALNVAVSY